MSQLSHAQFPLRRLDHRRVRSAAVAEPRGANVESRDRLRWPASFRNGGRNQIGTVADIKSESPAGLPRNSHFSKLLMIRDLEPAAWGENSIVDHPLLRGLLTEGFNEEPSPIPDNSQLDTLFAPA